ncbi:hypothetical protein VHEMI02382 [[Torrubiella] hemipterigena]|uniref:DUF3824 domain-containing protein n=1 Tax=[Torrubiella] hemipterigena TaxID=1531966 RepID=A0A0A1SVL4_9HYPO|nr:hypothetical protein VHEMI02382 [[Torrubiella] hemipterigena]
MASYEPYDRDRDYGRRYVREDSRRDERDAPRFLDPYGRPPPGGELVPRRQDSDMSVEEIRREFPPPSGRDIRRARSAEGGPVYWEQEYGRTRGHDSRGYYERERERSYDRRPRRHHDDYDDDDRKSKSKSGMSKQEKIIAAVAGAALLAGGKELYDRREAKEHHGDVQRNPLSSVALAGLGALAGYQGAEFYNKQQAKRDQKTNYILQRGRDGNMHEYYSDDDDGSKEKKGHKNFLENALAATGLGAAVKQLTGGGGDDRRSERGGSRRGSPSGTSRAGSRERGGGGANKIQKAAMASLLAGATEAFRVAKEPGGWRGEKAKRVLTAAAGAATVDATVGGDHGKLGLAESVIGGLVGNRLINGSKRDIEEDKATGRSRSRSRAASRGGSSGGGGAGLAALATAGLGALGAKKMIDHSRSRSRGRDRSPDSRGSSPDRPRLRDRSRSVVDKARNSLARLGIGSSDDKDDRRRRDQDDYDDYDSRGSRGGSRRYHDDEYDDRSHSGRGHDDRDRHGGGGSSGRDRSRDRRRGGYGSESDLGDSDQDERRHRKMRGKQIITTGLATVATIHAAHEVYQSVEKRNARQRAVRDGRLSSMEAKKLKTKALMQDAASVGIAAMGIKGALSEMKEAKELNHECKEFGQLKAKRHQKRLQRRKKLDGDRMSDHESRFEPKRLQRPGTWAGPTAMRWEDGAPPLPPPIELR